MGNRNTGELDWQRVDGTPKYKLSSWLGVFGYAQPMQGGKVKVWVGARMETARDVGEVGSMAEARQVILVANS